MASGLDIQILAPDKPVAEVKAKSLMVPGTLGYMTSLAGHAPMVTELDIGHLKVEKEGSEDLNYFVSGGYVEILQDKVVVLADVVENPNDIDADRAESASKRAKDRLASKDTEVDQLRAQSSLKRAEARLAIFRLLTSK